MSWPISTHESPDVNLSIPAVTAPHYLWAFLRADTEQFRAGDYQKVREYLAHAVASFATRTSGGQTPSPSVSEQRLRTWKAAFEEMGLLTVDESGALQATRFGRAIVDGLEDVDQLLTRTNRHITELGAQVANRVLLARPDGRGQSPAGVPPDSDILPLRVIWRALRHLGNQLHWQDINRVLGHLHYERDVSAALDQIAQFRRRYSTNYPTSAADLDRLGQPALTTDPRHITPWFNRAGLGGLLIPSEADTSGFRVLPTPSITIIDGLLGDPPPTPPDAARTNREAYIAYLMEPVERASHHALDARDAALADRVIQAVHQFGARHIVVLAGLPGTGKSRMARLVADHLTEGDPFRLKDIQFHDSTTYEDFIEGFVPRPDGQGFERRDKTFRVINQRALDDPSHQYVLLIEEFTRANVHSVLGELLTFIEHRGRSFTLPLSQDEVSVAPNLVILATMNPRDKSAMTLDIAVTRRMHRVTVPPSVESLRDMLAGSLAPDVLNALTKWFESYLDVLPVGHGIFAAATGVESIRNIWMGTVIPLLSDPLGHIPDAYRAACDAFPFAS